MNATPMRSHRPNHICSRDPGAPPAPVLRFSPALAPLGTSWLRLRPSSSDGDCDLHMATGTQQFKLRDTEDEGGELHISEEGRRRF